MVPCPPSCCAPCCSRWCPRSSAHMPWLRLLSLTGMLLYLSGRKPCHVSTRRMLLSVLSLAASHGGSLSLDSSRYSSGNFVYVLFSPHNHYVYFSETCTPGREHQHLIVCYRLSASPQRVHVAMNRTGFSFSVSWRFLSLALSTGTCSNLPSSGNLMT